MPLHKAKLFNPVHNDCVTCHQGYDDFGIDDNAAIVNAPCDYEAPCSDRENLRVCSRTIKVTDKDVETCKNVPDCIYPRKSNCDENDDLRKRAFLMYKNYLASRKGSGKCPTCIYIGPKGQRVLLKGDSLGNDEAFYCEYDPSFNEFLSVVFMILFSMYLCTTAFMFVLLSTAWLRQMLRDFVFYMIAIPVAIILMVALNYSMTYIEISRRLPCNFLYLIVTVAIYNLLTSILTVLLDTTIIFLMYSATTVVVFIYILLALSHFDFTKWYLYLISVFLTLAAVIILVVLMGKFTKVRYGPMQFFILLVSTLINVVIIIIELQLILAGRTLQLDETDFAVGAFLLYTGVVELIKSLIQVTGVLDDTE